MKSHLFEISPQVRNQRLLVIPTKLRNQRHPEVSQMKIPCHPEVPQLRNPRVLEIPPKLRNRLPLGIPPKLITLHLEIPPHLKHPKRLIILRQVTDQNLEVIQQQRPTQPSLQLPNLHRHTAKDPHQILYLL